MAAVTLINCFEVPAGQEDEFFRLWQKVNAYMRAKPGYLAHALHRAWTPEAAFRFVNVARWVSAEHYQAAHDDGFRKLINDPAWKAFRARPALYEVVHEGHGETGSAVA